jgi:hypothetical protein
MENQNRKKKNRPMEENTLLKFHVFAGDLTTVGGPAATPLILSSKRLSYQVEYLFWPL